MEANCAGQVTSSDKTAIKQLETDDETIIFLRISELSHECL